MPSIPEIIVTDFEQNPRWRIPKGKRKANGPVFTFKMATHLTSGKVAKSTFRSTKSQAYARANAMVGRKYHGSRVERVTLDYPGEHAKRSKKARRTSYKRKPTASRKVRVRAAKGVDKQAVGIIPALFGFGAPKVSPRKDRLAAIRAAHTRHQSALKSRHKNPSSDDAFSVGRSYGLLSKLVPMAETTALQKALSKKQITMNGVRRFMLGFRAGNGHGPWAKPRRNPNEKNDAYYTGRAYAATCEGARGHGMDEDESFAHALVKGEADMGSKRAFIRGFRSLDD